MTALIVALHDAAARYHRALTGFRPAQRGRAPNREAAYQALCDLHARHGGVASLATALSAEGVNSGTATQIAHQLTRFCEAGSQEVRARYDAFKALHPLTGDGLRHHQKAGAPKREPAARKDLDG